MDGKELEAWLKTRPREDAVLIALRAALRVWPFWVAAARKAWARELELASLPYLRCALTAGVDRIFSGPDLKSASSFARAHSDAGNAADAAAGVAHAAGYPHYVLNSIASLVRAVGPYDYNIGDAVWKEVAADVSTLSAGEDLTTAQIWRNREVDVLRELERDSLTALHEVTGDPNSFWHRWYLGARDGQWLDWDLQREVALIPDEVWRQGHKAVSQAIAGIEERYELHRQVSALRAELDGLLASQTTQASAQHRSHNNPPELIDSVVVVRRQLSSLAATLVQTEEELCDSKPDKSRLRTLAESLRDGARAVVQYCVSLADTVMQAGAKSVGDKAGAALIVYVGTEPVMNAIVAVAKAILSYAAR